MSFTHLHVHGSYSPLDGLGTPEKMVVAAKERGFNAIGITDHGNIDSFIKFQSACKEHGVKPVFGVEMYMDENRFETGKEANRFHACFFIKNVTGFQNLQKLITIANLEGFCKKPRIDPSSVLNHCEGLILTTACLASFAQTSWGIKFLKDFLKKNPGDVYFEIMPIQVDKQKSFNFKMVKLASKLGCKIIATNDVHYIKQEDSELQEVMLAINSRAKWNDPNRWKFECNTHYLCSAKEMIKGFKLNHPDLDISLIRDALENTQEIVDKCSNFVIEKCPVIMPLIPQCKEGEEDKFLTDLVFAGLKKKIKEGKISKDRLPEYRARIDEELGLLKQKKFVRYFLIVWEMIEWCRKNDIMVGPGRGSAGGSLVAYLINIVQVDPLKYDLLFARFISVNRFDLPDIDTDYPDDKRHLVREHVQELYGENNVSGISTFLTIKGKGSIQDVARVFDVPKQEVNAVTKLIDDDQDLTLESFTESESEEVKEFARKYPQVVDYAIRLQHTVRGYGQHAAGVCIASDDLRNGTKCSLVKRKNEIVCNWDKDDAEFMGLVKMDFLGLSALSRIHECLKLIEENTGEAVNLENLEYDDSNVFDMINRGDTVGIFQLGTYGITKLCKDLGISEFKNLYNATALYRPGPLGSGMTDEFVQRKNGKRFKYICKEMEEITKNTFGIIVYQEQVMAACNKLGKMSWGECDKVRKLMAKSKGIEALESFKEKFVKGCVDNGILEEEKAVELWGQLAEFGKYGFNKCLALDTTVQTQKGETKLLCEVEIGEYIDTPEGFCRVKAKHSNGFRKLFNCIFSDGTIVKCTSPHKFLCNDNKKHPISEIWESQGKLRVKTKIGSVSLDAFEYVERNLTMDLEMENKSHTFYANRLATSNSHSVEYSVISYYDAWLKYYYPLEFFASYLTYSGDDKKKELMKTIVARGIEVKLPKVDISKAKRWQVKDRCLIMPFSEIAGIGESRAEQIEQSSSKKRVGFFGGQKLSIPESANKILQEVKAFDKDYEFSYKEMEEIQKYFIYDVLDMFFE